MIFQVLANTRLFLQWYPAGQHFSFCRSSKGLIIVYTTVKLSWRGEDFYGTFTKRKKESKAVESVVTKSGVWNSGTQNISFG
jgi:hypothetical protein